MTKYYIDSYGSESLLLHKAFDLTLTLAKSSFLRQAAVATENKNHILSSGNWREIISERQIRILCSGRTNIERCKFYLLTKRLTPPEFTGGPVLAYGISILFLNNVIENPKVTDVIFAPQTSNDLQLFKRNNPEAISF